MILESGALYCAGGIALVVLATSIPTGTTERLVSDLISGAVLGQLVGIAPTIIAVRVGLGQSVESVGSFAATGQPRTQNSPKFHATATAQSTEQHVLYLRPASENDRRKAEIV